MRAVVFEEFGGPEVLGVREIDAPQAGAGQVRIAVKAAGVNPMDYKVRRGWFEAMMPTTFPAVPGVEVVGIVDEVGEGAEFAVGDEVVGWTVSGGYAEHALLGNAVRKPAGVSWEQAVAVPVAGETAQRVLDLLKVKSGETLLLHGAAGAVGAVAVQLAVVAGVTVVGTASEANHEYLRSLGATPVAYGDGLVDRVRAVAPVIDAVFDAAGQGGLKESIELRGGPERIVTIADMSAGELGIEVSPGGTAPEIVKGWLADQLQLAADGKLKLRIAETFPLTDADAAKAQEISESGHAKGKLVLVP
ncbi:NADP-dependent oxidoreductase [Kribbella sp. DT2]|uniref:NADP-dependent oxidoreductase n=1 Tax=Kribbella sp. DT2 TaxID=3393427 RepID=UPI003CEF4267